MAFVIPTITQLIAERIPVGFAFKAGYVDNLTAKWQFMLRDNLSPVPSDDETVTDDPWSYEFRVLIASLVVFDAINEIAAQAALGNLTLAANGEGGEIKKITTGPDDVEFIATSQSFVSLFKPTSTGQTALDFLKDEMCSMASYLKIRIIACGPYKSPLIQLMSAAGLGVNDPNYILNCYTRPIAMTSQLYSVSGWIFGCRPADQG